MPCCAGLCHSCSLCLPPWLTTSWMNQRHPKGGSLDGVGFPRNCRLLFGVEEEMQVPKTRRRVVWSVCFAASASEFWGPCADIRPLLSLQTCALHPSAGCLLAAFGDFFRPACTVEPQPTGWLSMKRPTRKNRQQFLGLVSTNPPRVTPMRVDKVNQPRVKQNHPTSPESGLGVSIEPSVCIGQNSTTRGPQILVHVSTY